MLEIEAAGCLEVGGTTALAAGCLEVGGTTALATVFVPALEAANCFPVF